MTNQIAVFQLIAFFKHRKDCALFFFFLDSVYRSYINRRKCVRKVSDIVNKVFQGLGITDTKSEQLMMVAGVLLHCSSHPIWEQCLFPVFSSYF